MLPNEDLRDRTEADTVDLGTVTQVPQDSECARSFFRVQDSSRRLTDMPLSCAKGADRQRLAT